MQFSEVRQKYPQYSDLSDEQLARGLHDKFYNDMPFDQFASSIGYKATPEKPTEDTDSTAGFLGGNLAKGVAQILGMPMDIATSIGNMAIGAERLPGMPPSSTAPPPIQPLPGGSQTFENIGRKIGAIGPSAEPTSKGGEYAAAAIQAIPSALTPFGWGAKLKQLPRALTAAITSGLGGQFGKDIAPEGYEDVGQVVGAMAPGARRLKPPSPQMEAEQTRKAAMFGTAKEMGVPVLPREMKIDEKNLKLQKNLTSELGMPETTNINPGTMDAYRKEQYTRGYQPIIKEPSLGGIIVADPANVGVSNFDKQIAQIAQEEAQRIAQFPGSVKDIGILTMLKDFQKRFYTTDEAMKEIQRMREQANKNISAPSATADSFRIGLTQRKIADAMENLIEENLTVIAKKPELAKQFRDSRTKIAQAFNIEAAIEPRTGKVDPAALAALGYEQPFTGKLKQAADVAREFPSAFKTDRFQEIFTHRVTPMAILHPQAALTHLGARLGDPIALSKPYQSLFVDPSHKLTREQEQFLRLVVGAKQGDTPPNEGAPPFMQ